MELLSIHMILFYNPKTTIQGTWYSSKYKALRTLNIIKIKIIRIKKE